MIDTRNSGLYPRLLGPAWASLAEPIRRAHAQSGAARGRFRIERGRHQLARLLGWILRLPPASPETEVRVSVTASRMGELWERHFGPHRILTRQYEKDGLLAERFGIVEFLFRLEVARGTLVFHQQHAALVAGPIRVPLPAALAPTIEATEETGPAGLQVTVRITLPAGGLLLSYQGIVEYSVEKL